MNIRKWTGQDFLIPISLKPNVINLKIMNSGRSNNLSFKYQRFTPAGSEYVGMVKFEFVAKIHFHNFHSRYDAMFK